MGLIYFINCLIAGIIARSAGAFENTKKVCSCSGKTLWEEARLDI
ncbi:20122_t:CDS:2 [Entrophospora sp. SA101]|nr:20122_t:CDS:2 [Entrophospora sp. SA101]